MKTLYGKKLINLSTHYVAVFKTTKTRDAFRQRILTDATKTNFGLDPNNHFSWAVANGLYFTFLEPMTLSVFIKNEIENES